MNKIILVFFLSAVMSLTFFTSCSQPYDSNSSTEGSNFPQLSEEIEYEIKEAFRNIYNTVPINLAYYGSYGGYEAVLNKDLGAAMILTKECGGHTFRFGTSNVILLYKDGVFINFDDAFKGGKISQEDIDRLYKVFSEHYPIW